MAPSKKDTTTKRQRKAAAEDGKPKRPLSGYMRFCTEKRASVKEAHPEMNNKEILSEMGRLWKEVSQEDKKKYAAAYEAEKKVFDEKMAEWKKTHPEEKKEKKARKTTKKATKKPAKEESEEDVESEEEEEVVPEESEEEEEETPTEESSPEEPAEESD
ncbi:hypothetical protein WA538_006143 [Blastocystis sp. DL]